MRRVVIIGGGAAGLTAAITASKCGDAVTLLEHTPELGKKILSTGNGRCNLTNRNQNQEFYRCTEKEFPKAALKRFGFHETLDFFEGLGLFFKERDGYVYPRSLQASSVRNVLLKEVMRCHVDTRTETEVKEIKKEKDQFLVRTSDMSFAADSVIMACGGKAAPATGSDGSGYVLSLKLGHRLVTPVPALTGLKAPNASMKKAAGVRAFGCVSLYIKENGEKRLAASDTGEIQLTEYGISGIPVFQVSRYAARALEEGAEAWVSLNFLPEYEREEAEEFLDMLFGREEKRDCLEVLCGLFPEKLSLAFLKSTKISPHLSVSDLEEKHRSALKRAICAFSITVTGTNSFSQSQVTAGGIDVRDVEAGTMESRLVPGLYFAGEILDVDGICGGYNLQWAWTSGWLAGKQGRL